MSNKETTRIWKPRTGERVYGPGESEDGFTLTELEEIVADMKSLGMTHVLTERLTAVRYPSQPVEGQ